MGSNLSNEVVLVQATPRVMLSRPNDGEKMKPSSQLRRKTPRFVIYVKDVIWYRTLFVRRVLWYSKLMDRGRPLRNPLREKISKKGHPLFLILKNNTFVRNFL